MSLATTVEERTQEIGREIFAEIDTSGPTVFSSQWWDDWVMDWSMANEAVKVQMFRFIDVLPMLTTPEMVAEHLQAYFADSEGHFPVMVRMGAGLADPKTVRGRVLARAIRLNATRLARRFIAGSTPREVLASVTNLRQRKMTFTLDLLGEATVTESEADLYQNQYFELLDGLCPQAKLWEELPHLDADERGAIPRVNLSIKVTALYSQFDPIDPKGTYDRVAGRLREVFRAAMSHGAFINVDMEQYAYKDLTLYIFKRLLSEAEFRDWSDVGLAIQAYLPETDADLNDLLDWVKMRGAPVWIRLVKGAYWDYETVIARQLHWPIPVYTQKWQSDAQFERCAALILENYQWLRPAVASHNIRSMAHALALAERFELPPRSFELQMLYGMGDEIKQAFVKRGYRLRIYTPFGKLLPGMAYLVRRLLENTSNTSFLRATFTEHTSVEKLLQPPHAVGRTYHEVSMTDNNKPPENLPPFSNEPFRDFSRAVNRERMARALDDVRSQFGAEYSLHLDGEEVRTGRWLDSVNPADFQTIVGRIACAEETHADRAVAAARNAFGQWSRTSVWKRADVLLQTARLMRQRREELAAWMVYECGKQWREADGDVCEAIDFCEFYPRAMLEMSSPRRRHQPGEENDYFYHPRGVCVTIAPWNFPLAILCGMTGAPLVAGNTVVMKPAEQSSVVAALFFDLLRQAGAPDGVVQFLPGIGEEVGAHLVQHPDVSVITFTGSVAVGLQINQTAAQPHDGQHQVKHVLAEMGGKNAIIVDDDADLDEAVSGVVASAYGYQGQKCSACSRVIVLKRVYDAFINRLTEAVRSLEIGPPEDPAFSVGPVIDAEAFERLTAVVEEAKSSATCLYAGDVGSLASRGYYIGPHLFANADHKSALGQQEFFGPVLAAFKAESLDDALAMANDTPYALTGGLYSRNPRTIQRCKEEFLVGNLYLNRKITGALVDLQPFGGFKLSGIGAKAGGPDYLHQFVVPRTVTENTIRRGFAPEEQS